MPPGVAGRGGIKPMLCPKLRKSGFMPLEPWAQGLHYTIFGGPRAIGPRLTLCDVAGVAGRGGHKTSFCAQSEEQVVLCPLLGAGGERRRAGGGHKTMFCVEGDEKVVLCPLASQGVGA